MNKHRQLFTSRQLKVLSVLTDLVADARRQVMSDGGTTEYADAIATYLALAVSRVADWNNSLSRWENKAQVPQQLFARQAVPMVWDFSEANPLGRSTGSLLASVQNIIRSVAGFPASPSQAAVVQLDATQSLPTKHAVICTDPPYYDNIGYADLSDFFYVWLRRSLREIEPALFSTILVPKSQELVATPYRFGGNRDAADAHFESGLESAFRLMRAAQADGFPMTVIYAFKQAEEGEEEGVLASTGWEKMLAGLISAGLAVLGTWPIRTEAANRMIARSTNALASSVALVCRPRRDDALLATRKDFLSALKKEVPGALRHLQQGSIAPVDLAQAAIGPGMAVFSRYAKVVEADGSAMTVRTALELINQVLDETLAEQEADFDADTRWAVAWFEQHGLNPGPFGAAETLSKAKNTAVNGLAAAGILESKAGKVRLLDRSELSEAWDPGADKRLTVWEVTQHLIRTLESGGDEACASLLRRVGGLGETARELAYRLYVICERKKWAKEALAYNSLVAAWPEIARLAAGASSATGQGTLL